jgi:hypothetical protein
VLSEVDGDAADGLPVEREQKNLQIQWSLAIRTKTAPTILFDRPESLSLKTMICYFFTKDW